MRSQLIRLRSKGQTHAESQDWTVVGASEDVDASAIKLAPLCDYSWLSTFEATMAASSTCAKAIFAIRTSI